ncbi:MAG TPA: tetratricopeptide repeat protein [Terriglobia bacterium]|nr:tetratricopeptide repeat protein [Terriglobia bacterium]
MRRCLLSVIAAVGMGALVLGAQNARFPALPQIDLSEFPAVVREQVAKAYEAARANPNDAEANGELGMLLDVYKRRDFAAICYERAHQLDPKSFRWPYYLGSLRTEQGDRAGATATFREALRLDPDYLPARLKLAESLLTSGKLEAAGSMYDAIIKGHPGVAEAYYGLGRIRTAQGDLAGAVKSYQKACELFPAYGAAHYALARAYRRLGDLRKSEEQLKLHDANPTLVPPIQDPLRDALRTRDRGPASIVEQGIQLEEAGRIEDSIAAHLKALELDPGLALAHANLIILYGKTKQPEKAGEHYREAVRLNPNLAEAHYNYGVLLMGEGKMAEAEQAFRRALKANPVYAEAYNNLGVALEQQGKLDEALQSFEKAVERKPDYRFAHFHIGRILANRNEYAGAIEHFKKILTPEDDHTPTYLYALAATYARAGDRQNALAYGRRARDAAAARGQTALRDRIERGLKDLDQKP